MPDRKLATWYLRAIKRNYENGVRREEYEPLLMECDTCGVRWQRHTWIGVEHKVTTPARLTELWCCSQCRTLRRGALLAMSSTRLDLDSVILWPAIETDRPMAEG